MTFENELRTLHAGPLVLRTGLMLDALYDQGFVDDIVFALDLSAGTATPLTYEEDIPFHHELWGALRTLLADFPGDGLQLESSAGDVLYSAYDGVESDLFDAANVLQIFKACVVASRR